MDAHNRPTIHYTQLGEFQPGTPLAEELSTYKRELPRLLAEGHEGRAILIKGDQIVGLFDNEQEAVRAGYARFLRQSFLVHTIRTYEPIYRVSGYCYHATPDASSTAARNGH